MGVETFVPWAAIAEALATIGLLITAAVAASQGLRALRLNNQALQLESLPFIIVSKAESPEVDARVPKFVVVKGADGLQLRAFDADLDNPRPRQGGAVYHGAPAGWLSGLISIKNVGRSPAVACQIIVTVIAGDGRRQHKGYGTIDLPEVMPGVTKYVAVENRLARVVSLTFHDKGVIARSPAGDLITIGCYLESNPMAIPGSYIGAEL